MKGFGRFPSPAAAVAVALGLLGGEARAEFLTQARATLNARGDSPGSVAGSDITLTAAYAPVAGASAQPDLTYTWSLGFAHGDSLSSDGTPSYSLVTQVTGDTSVGVRVPTAGEFTEPVIGFFTLGSTVSFQLAATAAPDGLLTTGGDPVGVTVDTATGVVDITTHPDPGATLGPPLPAGSVSAVPEPATIALLGAGGLLLLIPRLRRRLRREG